MQPFGECDCGGVAELGAGADRGSSPLVPVGIMRERELQCSSRNSNVSRAALETTEEVRQACPTT
jgi:hypothetical protein